jgi:HEAT repeat protein
VPALIDIARVGSPKDNPARVNALAALGRIGSGAKEAVPALADLVKGKDATAVRCQAAIALGQIGPDAKGAVPALAAAVAEPASQSGPLRFHAVEALGKIGPGAKDAVEALGKAQEDKVLAGPAQKALEKIRGGKEKE